MMNGFELPPLEKDTLPELITLAAHVKKNGACHHPLHFAISNFEFYPTQC